MSSTMPHSHYKQETDQAEKVDFEVKDPDIAQFSKPIQTGNEDVGLASKASDIA